MTKMKCLKLKTPRGIQEYPTMPNMDAALLWYTQFDFFYLDLVFHGNAA